MIKNHFCSNPIPIKSIHLFLLKDVARVPAPRGKNIFEFEVEIKRILFAYVNTTIVIINLKRVNTTIAFLKRVNTTC